MADTGTQQHEKRTSRSCLLSFDFRSGYVFCIKNYKLYHKMLIIYQKNICLQARLLLLKKKQQIVKFGIELRQS